MARLRKFGRWCWWECGPGWLVLAAAGAWTGWEGSLLGGLLLVVALHVAEKWTLRREKTLPGPGQRRFEFPNGVMVTVAGSRRRPAPLLIQNLSTEWGPPVEIER